MTPLMVLRIVVITASIALGIWLWCAAAREDKTVKRSRSCARPCCRPSTGRHRVPTTPTRQRMLTSHPVTGSKTAS